MKPIYPLHPTALTALLPRIWNMHWNWPEITTSGFFTDISNMMHGWGCYRKDISTIRVPENRLSVVQLWCNLGYNRRKSCARTSGNNELLYTGGYTSLLRWNFRNKIQERIWEVTEVTLDILSSIHLQRSCAEWPTGYGIQRLSDTVTPHGARANSHSIQYSHRIQ